MRIPRKKKKQIPIGMYCYEINSDWQYFKDGSYGVKVKPCPFYQQKSKGVFGGWCKLIDGEVMDQCKSCGLKYGF